MASFEKILSDLSNKQYQPIYFLSGDESYFIDKISGYIQDNALGEAEKSFNQTVLYGKDTDAITITNAAKRFPMMADKQVVIVKEAQEIKDFENLIHTKSLINERKFSNPFRSIVFTWRRRSYMTIRCLAGLLNMLIQKAIQLSTKQQCFWWNSWEANCQKSPMRLIN